MRWRGFSVGDGGSMLVEFALLLPLLLLMLGGFIEFGRMIEHRHIIDKSVHDAARYLAREPSISLSGGACGPGDETVIKARNLALYGNSQGVGQPLIAYWTDPATVCIDTRTVVVTGEDGTSLARSVVRVTARVRYEDLGWIGLLGIGTTELGASHDMVMG